MSKDAPSPDVAGLIEAAQSALSAMIHARINLALPETGVQKRAWLSLLEAIATLDAALSRLTPPKQAAYTADAVRVERDEARALAMSLNEGGKKLEAKLNSARADGIREASKAANEVHEYYARLRDRTPTGTTNHDVAQECVIASARTWRAVAALLPDQPAAIRALKDAGGPDVH